jgi:hypothetical protein
MTIVTDFHSVIGLYKVRGYGVSTMMIYYLLTPLLVG